MIYGTEKVIEILLKIGWDKIAGWLSKILNKNIPSIEELKRQTQILFVDDESFEERISEIRSAGWNVRQSKDIENFDSEEVKAADIIFMDYKGVGKQMAQKEEGVGLLKHLRKKYPRKCLIFYSGYAGWIPGHEVHGIADKWIQKHADTYEYIDLIEESAKKLHE